MQLPVSKLHFCASTLTSSFSSVYYKTITTIPLPLFNSLPHTHETTRLGLLVRLVVDLGSVVPVLRLAGLRVRDGLGGQEVPVVLQRATLDAAVVDLHLVRVVRSDDERVQVGELVVLAMGEKRGDGRLLSFLGFFYHWHYIVIYISSVL